MVSAVRFHNDEDYRKQPYTQLDRQDTIQLLTDFYIKVPKDFDEIIKGFTYAQLEKWRTQYIREHSK